MSLYSTVRTRNVPIAPEIRFMPSKSKAVTSH